MTVFKKMINLNAELKVLTVKTIASLVFEINGNGRDIKIVLIEILPQLGAIEFEIWSLETVVFFLIPCFVNVVTKEQYSYILYYKLWRLY